MTDSDLLAMLAGPPPGVSVNSLAALIDAPWCAHHLAFLRIQNDYQQHRLGPKIDLRKALANADIESAGEGCRYEVRGSVALVAFDGLMYPKPNLYTKVFGGTTLRAVGANLKHALANERVKSIVLAIDSPGGSIFGVAELAAMVVEAATQKPIVAHSDQNMLSAAYWVGSAANAVYLSGPTVQAGSIGVMMRKTWDPTMGERSIEFCAGRYTRAEMGQSQPDSLAVETLQSRCNFLYSVFVEQVATHRGVSVERANLDMAEGRVFIGQQAIDAGLADGLMTLDQLVSDLATNPGQYATRRRVRARRAGEPFSRRLAATAPATAAPARPAKRHFRSADELKLAALEYASTHQTDFPSALKALGY